MFCLSRIIQRFGVLFVAALMFFSFGCASTTPVSPAESVAQQPPPTDAVSADVSESKAVFPTPENTVQAFIKALADDDFEAVLATCAADEVASSYQLEEIVELTRVYALNVHSMQSDGGLFTGTNRYRYADHIANQTNAFCVSLAVDSETSVVLDGNMLHLDEDDNANLFKKYLKQLEEKPWKKLQLVYMENIMDGEMFKNDAEMTALFTEQAARYGGDEKQEWMVVYSCGKRYFMQGMTLIRYQDTWKIYSMDSVLLNTRSNAGALPMESLNGKSKAEVLAYFETSAEMP